MLNNIDNHTDLLRKGFKTKFGFDFHSDIIKLMCKIIILRAYIVPFL